MVGFGCVQGHVITLGGLRRSVDYLSTLEAYAAALAIWAHLGSAPQKQHTIFFHTQLSNV